MQGFPPNTFPKPNAIINAYQIRRVRSGSLTFSNKLSKVWTLIHFLYLYSSLLNKERESFPAALSNLISITYVLYGVETTLSFGLENVCHDIQLKCFRPGPPLQTSSTLYCKVSHHIRPSKPYHAEGLDNVWRSGIDTSPASVVCYTV